MAKAIIRRIAGALDGIPGVEAVTLGGSRVTGVASEGSDIDIGVYYDRTLLDFHRLNEAARALDDAHRENLVCREGGWGPWVNCGGWLTVEGIPTDLILRDVERVRRVVEETERGEFSVNYHNGHPHAFISAMYRGELAEGRLLWGSAEMAALKQRAEGYPEALQAAMLRRFRGEMTFSLAGAEKGANCGDWAYAVGQMYRTVAAMNQVLFALNEVYCLNEKKAARRIGGMRLRPDCYEARVNDIFRLEPGVAMAALRGLAAEVEGLL